MNVQSLNKLSFKKFKKYMNATQALRFKITELKDKHPLHEHYYNMIDELQSLPFEIYKRYYQKWFSEISYYKQAS